MSATRLLLFCVLILAMGCGCFRREPADLTIINGQDPESLDPAITSGLEDFRVTRALFEGLTRFDAETARPVPGMAERWRISEDSTVYEFDLRPGLVWSTGEPLTALDVHWSWMRVLEPSTAAPYANLLFFVRNAKAYHQGTVTDPNQVGLQVLNDRQFRVELTTPVPFFLELCSFPTFSAVPRSVIEAHGDGWLSVKPLPTSGPYTLVSWRLNDRIRLRRNERYWRADDVRSELVDLLSCGVSTALNLYESGVVDVIWDQDLLPPELLPRLRERDDLHRFDFLGTYFLRINVTRPPFGDARIRQALALVIDKQTLVDRIVNGGETVAGSFVPEGVADYDPPNGLSRDPQRARELLAAAGYPGGEGFPTFEILYFGSPGSGDINQKIAFELREVWRQELGVRADLRRIEKKVFFSRQRSLEYDVSCSNWIGDYNDATTFLDLFRSDNGNNRTGWGSDVYDGFMDAAVKAPDIDARAALLRDAERFLVTEALPLIPIYFFSGFNMFHPDRVKGIHQNILDVHPLDAIYVEHEPQTFD